MNVYDDPDQVWRCRDGARLRDPGRLLCCEMVAGRGKSLGRQLHELFVKVDSFYPQRENFRLTPDVQEKFTEKLGENPRDFFGRRVVRVYSEAVLRKIW